MENLPLPGQSGTAQQGTGSTGLLPSAYAEHAVAARINAEKILGSDLLPVAVSPTISTAPVAQTVSPLPPKEAKDASTPAAQRRALAIRPLPQPAPALRLPASTSEPVSTGSPGNTLAAAPPRLLQPKVQIDAPGGLTQVQPVPSSSLRPPAPAANLFSGAETTTPFSASAEYSSIVQLQLSFRNLKGGDLLSLADPLAIISCSAGSLQRGWTELGRTECKINSTNPNFHQKVIVSLPKLESQADGEMMRVDVYDLDDGTAVDFDPLASAATASHLGGICFSAFSVAQILPSDSSTFTDPISLFFKLSSSSSAPSGTLPPLQAQAPREFNVMLAASATPFCVMTCCPVASNHSSFDYNNATQITSKYVRTSASLEASSTRLLDTLKDRDALVIQQSIAAYASSFSSSFPAFAKTHLAGRMLLMNNWGVLRVAISELVDLARQHPVQFYSFNAHGQQPLSCMFNSCLYALADRIKANHNSTAAFDTRDFPDVFTVVAALTQGVMALAKNISDAEAAAFQTRYCSNSLEVAVEREVQMLLSRPFAATDSTYVLSTFGVAQLFCHFTFAGTWPPTISIDKKTFWSLSV
jgi:hypothetical protein